MFRTGKYNRISIHAPLRERLLLLLLVSITLVFQSTLPCGSDFKLGFITINGAISIHAPLRERPASIIALIISSLNFNPRSLAGATSSKVFSCYCQVRFQSTLPCGSDLGLIHQIVDVKISIHAPLRERPQQPLTPHSLLLFQSTLPCGSD